MKKIDTYQPLETTSLEDMEEVIMEGFSQKSDRDRAALMPIAFLQELLSNIRCMWSARFC